MKKIAFLCPYFGELPSHFQLWLNSCSLNKEHTWFIFTDDKRKYDYPKNVIVNYMTIEELKLRFQKKFDFPICLSGAYKLGDYKPLYGFLFEELIKDYDAWGHIDIPDEIYGRISEFVTDYMLDKYDKLMLFGHMSIYKNSYEVNRRFMESSDISLTYRDIFSTDKFYNFEEIAPGSITKIYQYNNWEIGRLDNYIADISGLNFAFKLAIWNKDCTRYHYTKDPMIFSWENGRVYGYSLNNNKIERKEYLYVHFKRRKMNVDVNINSKEYYIIPTGFIPKKGKISNKIIKDNSKNKLFYNVYFKEKKKGLKRRLYRLGEKWGLLK